jgi:hypothetical protein
VLVSGQDDVPGLQVKMASDKWVIAPTIPGDQQGPCSHVLASLAPWSGIVLLTKRFRRRRSSAGGKVLPAVPALHAGVSSNK